MIKAVIFDMDGLMFDTESAYTEVHTQMFGKRGKEFTPEIKSQLMGKRASEVMTTLNEVWGQNERVEELLVEQDELLIKIYRDSVEMMPGLVQLLQYLNERSIRICIGTSSRRFLVDILLTRYGLLETFEFVVTGDMVSRGKPSPDIFQACLAKLGMEGAETLVLEDSSNGVFAAVAAKCNVIAIPSIHTAHEDFSRASVLAASLDDHKIVDYIANS